MTASLWREAWKLERYGNMIPEKVEIMDVGSGQYVIVKGEEHTTYRGNFYATPEAAFDDAIAAEERLLEACKRRLGLLRNAKVMHAGAMDLG